MMDTTTIRRTPVFLPVSCRFRAAVVKTSVAGFCSGEGPMATSMTHSTPVRAFTSPFLVITSTPREREIGTTLCPWALSTSTTCWPTRPVAPATATFMFVLFLADFSLSVMPDSRLQRFVRDSLYEWGPVVGPNRSTFHEAGRLMEAPASSHLVTGNADALAYFCKLCQTEMSLVAGCLVPLPFVAKTRRTYFEDVGSILVPCVICSARIGERDLRSHFASVHPEEIRHFRNSFWMARISPNGIVLYGLLAATFLSLLGLGVWVWLPLLVWVGLFVLWAVFARRHWKKARAAWQTAHGLAALPQ